MSTTPLVNGHKHQFASVQVEISSKTFDQFTKVSYKHSLDRGEAMGNQREPLGYTKGEYKREASVTMSLRRYHDFIAYLGDGYMDKVFPITVSYSDDDGGGIITDEIIGCRIKEVSKDLSKGTDAIEVEVSLNVIKIRENGLDPLENMNGAG